MYFESMTVDVLCISSAHTLEKGTVDTEGMFILDSFTYYWNGRYIFLNTFNVWIFIQYDAYRSSIIN